MNPSRIDELQSAYFPLILPKFIECKTRITSYISALRFLRLAIDSFTPLTNRDKQRQGGGIVYAPPENLAEYLDSGLVPPVTGGTARGGAQGFFDEVSDKRR